MAARDLDDDSYSGITLLPPRAEMLALPRASSAVQLNRIALRNLDCRLLLCIGDDNVFRTDGWDRLLMEAVEEHGSGFYTTNDLISDPPGAHMAITTDIVEALGWMAEPSMHHYFVDNVWAELGHGAGCWNYLPDVVIEHVHYSTGKVVQDQTYQSSYANWFAPDEVAFTRWRTWRRAADLATVVRVLEQNRKDAR